MPPNQLLIGFALFLSIFVMQPTGKEIYDKAIFPYMKDKMTSVQAIDQIEISLRGFMTKQVRTADIQLFYDVTGSRSQIPLLTCLSTF